MKDTIKRTQVEQSLDDVIGNPSLITKPEAYQSECLYQAFNSAVQTFYYGEQDFNYIEDNSKKLLLNAYNALKNRVANSRQEQAQQCLDNFEKRFSRILKIVSPTSTPNHHPTGTTLHL